MAYRLILALRLSCLALFTSLWLWSPSAHSKDRFRNCHQYDAEIQSAVDTYWGSFPYPLAWKAQLYQESLCNPEAVSYVGASGIAQFMPRTWREMETRFGVKASPHEDIAIEWGAYYMARQMRVWTSKRPQYERWRLGMAGYNAGAGNIVRAQKICGGVLYWREIELCLPYVTGHHAKETRTYVPRIERWWCELARHDPSEIHPAIAKGKSCSLY